MTKISIAMGTYNGERFLKEQLESITAQTLPPAELVVCDDGSIDDTFAILESFADRAPFPVRIHRNERNLGYRANFMKCASLCSGDLIAFCDQDDVWRDNKLSDVQRIFEKDPSVLAVFHNSMVTNANGSELRLFYQSPPCPAKCPPLTLPPIFFPFGFSQTIRSSLLLAIPFRDRTPDWFDPKQSAAHDLFFFALASSVGTIAYIDHPLVDYRQHGNNLFGAVAEKTAEVSRLLKDNRDILAHFSIVSNAYAKAVLALSDLPEQKLNSKNAIYSWQLLSDIYGMRADVRGNKNILKRIKAFISLFSRGAYGEHGMWTFGRRSALQDFSSGVILQSYVAKHGFPQKNDGSLRRGRALSVHADP